MRVYRLFLPILILGNLTANGQDTLKVLFIGNSFTSANQLPALFNKLCLDNQKAVKVYQHVPGGISVADTAQGTSAHWRNSTLFSLIRTKKPDVAIIQDNQGRFVLDSGLFPGASPVIAGHLKLADSVSFYNSCSKVILFAGWGTQNGLPPYGNTGIEMIDRILKNYLHLNKQMFETIAPIGEAYKLSITTNPTLNLWASDQTHPSINGSFLSALVIVKTLFDTPIDSIAPPNGINLSNAQELKHMADSVFSIGLIKEKYNIIYAPKQIPQFSNAPLNTYWYANHWLTDSGQYFAPDTNKMCYSVLSVNGFKFKSCVSYGTVTQLTQTNFVKPTLFSVVGNQSIRVNHKIDLLNIYTLTGQLLIQLKNQPIGNIIEMPNPEVTKVIIAITNSGIKQSMIFGF